MMRIDMMLDVSANEGCIFRGSVCEKGFTHER